VDFKFFLIDKLLNFRIGFIQVIFF